MGGFATTHYLQIGVLRGNFQDFGPSDALREDE